VRGKVTGDLGRLGAIAVLVFGLVLAGNEHSVAQSKGSEAMPELALSVDRGNLRDGFFRLDFGLPQEVEPGRDGYFVRVQETDGALGREFSVLTESEWFRRETSDSTYRARLCRLQGLNRTDCGTWSDPVSIEVPAGLSSAVPMDIGSGSAPVRGGPDEIASGVYSSSLTQYNAWHFNWANHLRFPQLAGVLPDERFDLAIRWQTYEYDSSLGRTVPIWLWSQLEISDTSGATWTGALYYRQEIGGVLQSVNVGQLEITPSAGTSAPDATVMGIRWRTDRSSMYGGGQSPNTWVNDTLTYSSAAGTPGTAPMAHDSYSGDWRDDPDVPPDQKVSLLFWIENQVERIDALFQDAVGRPVWALATRHNTAGDPLTQGMEGFCAYTVFDGPLPNQPASGAPTVEFLDCGGAGEPDFNMGRSFDPIEPGISRDGSFWVDLQLPPYRPGALRYATSAAPGAIEKISRFHDIRPVIGGVDGQTLCVLDSGASCEVNLRWMLDGTYPDAAVYRRSLPGGAPVRIFNSVDEAMSLSPSVFLGVGAYEFQVRRNGASTSDLLALSGPLEIRSIQTETPPAPVADPGFQSDTTSIRTGATRGEFRVAESGAASYRIPFITAPSGGNVKPGIALSYNSQSGMGAAGPGWNLEGLGAITRCAKTYETDDVNGGVTLSGDDRFCLNGQRLIATSGDYGANGTEYRLEVDQIVRIKSFGSQGGGPAWFQVWRKDGTISWFGATESGGADTGSSRVSSKTHGASSPVWSWNLGRIEDSAGNYMRFLWTDVGATGRVESVINRIEYGGHTSSPTIAPYNQLIFNWETLPTTDQRLGFSAGVLLTTTRRLQSIRSLASGQELREYSLAYTMASGTPYRPGRLETVTECNGIHCFPPTQFSWYQVEPELGAVQGGKSWDFEIPGPNNAQQIQLADLNADGMDDLIYLDRQPISSSPPRIKYFLAQRQSSGGIEFSGTRLDGGTLHPSVPSNDSLPIIKLMDADGDGQNELVYGYYDGSTQRTIFAQEWNGAGYGAATSVGEFSLGSGRNLHALDWDGDGLTDLLYMSSLGGIFSSVGVLRNVSQETDGTLFAEDSSFAIDLQQQHFEHQPADPIQFTLKPGRVFDSNGDGRADLILKIDLTVGSCPPHEICIPLGDDPEGDSTTPPDEENDGSGTEDPPPADSGDQPDGESPTTVRSRYVWFEMVEDSQGNPVLRSRLSLGRTESHTEPSTGGSIISQLNLVDLNNDGLSDLLYFDNSQDRWRFALNDGVNGFQNPVLLDSLDFWPNDGLLRGQLRLADVNGDELLDALFPSSSSSGSATWQVAYWRPWLNSGMGGFDATLTATNASAHRIDTGSLSLFADFNKDGKTDQILLRRDEDTRYEGLVARGRDQLTGSVGYQPTRMVRRITDGFGAWTELNYQSLLQDTVYQRGNDGPYTGFGAGAVVYDVLPPMYVVSTATSLSPQDGASCTTASPSTTGCTTQLQYFYADARVQGGGRGFLGFGEVTSYDPQSGMLTRSRYHQDFPFIGLPKATRSWFVSSSPWVSGSPAFPNWIESSCSAWTSSSWNSSGKVFLACSENTWSEADTVVSAGLTHPYLARSEEWSFNPSYSGATLSNSAFTHRVVTENSGVDAHGNVGQVEVRTHTSIGGTANQLARQFTVNQYTSTVSSTRWHLGRLTCSTVTSERASQSTVTRISTFGYDGGTGILNRETINASSCGDANGALRTDYVLDPFGNRIETTINGGDIAYSRRSKTTYDSRGRYVDAEQIWVDGAWRTTSNVFSRDRYGNVLHVQDGRGVQAWSYFDAMGRPYYSYSPDGAWTRILHRAGGHAYCPSGTKSREQVTAADGSQSWVCKDVLGRDTRTIVWGFSGERIHTDTWYDHASRGVRVSEPYIAGQSIYWSETIFDEIGRVEHVSLPDGATESLSYLTVGTGLALGIQTRSVNALGRLHRVERNALGEKLREIAADGGTTRYAYDALGQLVSTDGPLSGTVDKVVIEYDTRGNKSRMVDPDKGEWRYRHNALGELMCQIDAESQGTQIFRDELGREVARFDRTGVVSEHLCAGTQRGATAWIYDNTSGDGSFGQMTSESSQYGDGTGANHTATWVYSYDALGRPIQTDTTIAESGGFNRSYTQRTTYDEHGRLFQQFDAAGGGRGTRFLYNSRGYLSGLREARGGVDGQVYWTVTAQDARGQVTQAEFGNGIQVAASYDPATGRLEHKVDTTSVGAAVQDIELWWDAIGNLTRKHDLGGLRDQLELYDYDTRDRLTRVRRGIDGGFASTVQQLRYDQSGNILCKSDVSSLSCAFSSHVNYAYGAGSAGPHAATSAGNRTLDYDSNGNVVRDYASGVLDRTFSYTTYDKLRRVHRGTKQVEFHYGADRSRTLKRELEGGVVSIRTHYVGSVEVVWEGSNPALGTGEYRRYIGGVVIATWFEVSNIDRVRYQHTDHQGSITALTDENGQIEAQMGFDAWGQRRNGNNWNAVWQQWAMGITPAWAMNALAVTPRGYTGHEHVDDMGIIHMNGRIYDALLARFLQADPFVEDSTTLNRYTYVHNNPLAFTDPSGFFSFGLKDFFKLAAVVAISAVLPQTLVKFGFSKFMAAVTTGAVAGGISTGSVQGALVGAFTAGVFHGIGSGFESLAENNAWMKGSFLGSDFSGPALALKSVAHGLTGGVISKVQGGKFVHGFASAGTTQFASGGIDQIGGAGFSPLRITAAAVLGGTVSEISGGKFANGAVTGAFSRAFNDEGHGGSASEDSDFEITEEQRQLNIEGKVREFWESRLQNGDPIAKIALASLDPAGGVFDYLFGGTRINLRLQAFSRVYTGSELNLDEVRVQLMDAHVQAVDGDFTGVRGLLSPEQVARYHHDVFRGFGLPSTAFGGTPFTGAVSEADNFRILWCRGCDSD